METHNLLQLLSRQRTCAEPLFDRKRSEIMAQSVEVTA
eukprot:SAG11_NODE_22989_length_397_cov_0.523490_1_plen_37_part_01